MKILVLNSGSSSLRFQLIDTSPDRIRDNTDVMLARGIVERLGSADALIQYEVDGETKRVSAEIRTHEDAIRAAFERVLGEHGLIRNREEIEGVGHRVVHGGENFVHSVLIDDEVVRNIEAAIELAPLHNPHNLKGYRAAVQLLPHAPQAAVFDTAFHHTLPPKAFMYGLPYVHYTRDRIRRYGFHGTSHRYVSYRYAQLHGKTRDQFKLITLHLGNGCSICAIDHGRSVDTSMGYTPIEGLIMGTRPGDIDPGAVLHLAGRVEMGLNELDVLLNKHSGLYGLSGMSNDMCELLKAASEGNARAELAIDVFCYRVKKYIGAYLAAMNGADAILFAGGIGENAAEIRRRCCTGLDALGVRIDNPRNESASGQQGRQTKEAKISADGSAVEAWVIPTNEELLIARDTVRCILGLERP